MFGTASNPGRRAIPALAAILVAAGAAIPCSAAVLVGRGNRSAVVVLPAVASIQEETAARELIGHLEEVTGKRLAIKPEPELSADQPAIFVGATEQARRRGLAAAELGAEEWIIEVDERDVVLIGGRPRGTLYAVYRFLEDRVGIRWWTPWETSVPSRPTLVVPPGSFRGRPGFAYRDITGAREGVRFSVRNRINGHYTRAPWELGGAIGYGPPRHVHDFYDYVPPDEYFESHPEYFSEIDGQRTSEHAQLCLTNRALRSLVTEKLKGYIEQARDEAARRGEPAPRLFAISQGDWGRPCQCETCQAAKLRTGSESGVLIEFLNEVADEVAIDYPDVVIDTLAYHYTFRPPDHVKPRENIVVRLTALQYRNFAESVLHPDNSVYRRVIEGWRAITPNLRIWDYAVTFGFYGDLPLPNLRHFAVDYRYYLSQGIDGIFVQLEYPIAGDLHDLKLWVMAKLLEDPGRDPTVLIRDFTDGYYGPAGKYVRRYIDLLERTADEHPVRIHPVANPDEYVYLDLEFVRRAQRLFDRAERSVGRSPELMRRVRHGRLPLDRATLLRFSLLLDEHLAQRPDPASFPLELASLARRYRETWLEQIQLRLPERKREERRADVDRELEMMMSAAAGVYEIK